MNGEKMDEKAAKIRAMLEKTRADREWFRAEAIRRRNPGMRIDAAACAIRERALCDALEALGDTP